MRGNISRPFFILVLLLALLPLSLSAQTLVNINTAGVVELDTLPGIGPAYAQRIVDYRNTNGPFETKEEIQNVSGIGPTTFADLKDLITVGEVGASSENADVNVNQSINQANQNESAHYSATPVTSVSKTSSPSVGAGRDRVGAVGSPLEFKVETGSKSDSYRQSIFSWNFGDGVQGTGPLVTHVYDYPGEYVVVLSANFPEGEAVARVNVKIVEPELTITLANPERVEIKNNSKQEVNLFGRAVWSGGSTFVFPRDTIVRAGQSISFSSRVTGLRPNSVFDTQMMVVGNTEQAKVKDKIEDEKVGRVAYLQNQIALLQTQMATLPKPHLEAKLPSDLVAQPLSEELVAEEELPVLEELDPVPQTALAKDGWFETLKRFFFRTK